VASVRTLRLARRAKRHGAHWPFVIIRNCRRLGVPISAGFALIEKESSFRNVFGHDPTGSIPVSWRGTKVTKSKYLHYKRNRQRGAGMQGVGPAQLTWYAFQDSADRLGGCWKARHSIRVGLGVFAHHYNSYKNRGYSNRSALQYAARDYNGAGPAAEAYGRDFLRKFDKWHRALTK
jgi:hypothetical protein